jgi:cytochrome bd ubiquinol oxidase subunit II
MELQFTWFILWAVLWAVYFMLDGFVLGIGMLSGVLGKNDMEKRILINSVGPVWNGNEVWLITAGGATFAAFPTTYALMFSYLYTALLLLLFALIIRGVAFEFRGKGDTQTWTSWADVAIILSGFVPALLFGVAFGNIFKGLPMDAMGYHGSLLTLLNPYGLITGALFVLLFAVHGALYASVKTTGELSMRGRRLAGKLWVPLLIVAVVFLGLTKFATGLYDNYFRWPVLMIIPVVAVGSLVAVKYFTAKDEMFKAFAFSCVTILFVTFTGVAGLYPNLIPSSIAPAYSLTIFNSSSSQYTLAIMTAVALIFVPIVIVYKIWVYRVFRARVDEKEVMGNSEAY